MQGEVSAPTRDRGALSLLVSKRPRNVSWRQAAGLLYGDWGTSRLYVLGLAFFFAPQNSLWLLLAMSFLLIAVGWAYTQICRVYPDGGGVYSAARRVSRNLAVIGALLLFADYVVTASLSALEAFHYFGLDSTESLLDWASPGLWAIASIVLIGAGNLLGPRHSGRFAIIAAIAMVSATLLICAFAIPQIHWSQLPERIGTPEPPFSGLWISFVGIVLALSGVEAIGNLTGVMQRPVARTSRRAIWIVAIEVALFNVILGIAMVSQLGNDQYAEHREDMMAFLSQAYVGHWLELIVRAFGGVLLLSAVNTVMTDMISVLYLLSRDMELPRFFQRLNRFGVPWIGAWVATLAPVIVLLLSHELEHLAALYAIGVVGAVAINVTLVATHPRLHGWKRKTAATALGLILITIWITLATTKLHALIFVTVVLAAGLTARWITKRFAAQSTRADLLHEAVTHQLSPKVLAMPRVMLATAGGTHLVESALKYSRQQGAALVVAFIREVSLTPAGPSDDKMTIENDTAAQTLFAEALHAGSQSGVPVIPAYDAGHNPVELLAEQAAVWGVHEILIGSTRRSALHKLIKGSFQRKLESLLPPEIQVRVLDLPSAP